MVPCGTKKGVTCRKQRVLCRQNVDYRRLVPIQNGIQVQEDDELKLQQYNSLALSPDVTISEQTRMITRGIDVFAKVWKQFHLEDIRPSLEEVKPKPYLLHSQSLPCLLGP